MDLDICKAVEEVYMSLLDANLGKDTSVKTDPNQTFDKQRCSQALPDPIASGATSDVPIHCEKTNILLHPIPSAQHPGKMFPYVSMLCGLKAELLMPGELHWEVGFFGKTWFHKALRTDGKPADSSKELRNNELHDEKSSAEDAVVRMVPDPLWSSGVLSVVIHQIVSLGSRTSRVSRQVPQGKGGGGFTSPLGTSAMSARSTVRHCLARTA